MHTIRVYSCFIAFIYRSILARILTPSGGGDMEMQKAYLKYNLVTSSVCLRHN